MVRGTWNSSAGKIITNTLKGGGGGNTFTWLHNQVGKKNREKSNQNQNLIRTEEGVEGGSKVVDIVAGDAVIQDNGAIVPKQVKQPHAALLARQSAASPG